MKLYYQLKYMLPLSYPYSFFLFFLSLRLTENIRLRLTKNRFPRAKDVSGTFGFILIPPSTEYFASTFVHKLMCKIFEDSFVLNAYHSFEMYKFKTDTPTCRTLRLLAGDQK